MPKEDNVYELGKAMSSVESTVASIAKMIEDKTVRDEKYFEAIFNNQKEANETITSILVRQEGMDARSAAHYKEDDLKFNTMNTLANDVQTLKQDKWKIQGMAGAVSFIVGALSAVGIHLTTKGS